VAGGPWGGKKGFSGETFEGNANWNDIYRARASAARWNGPRWGRVLEEAGEIIREVELSFGKGKKNPSQGITEISMTHHHQ